jgi:TPR repeat protein
MLKVRAFRSMAHTNAANALYQRADEQWGRGRMRSAFRLFLAAAKAGMVPASEIVGQFYDHGIGVKADQDLALYWYRRAYRHGYDSAANNIGCVWRDRKKVSRALVWLHRAVKLGDDDANLNIAKIYLRDNRSLKKAILYLKKVYRSRYVTEGSKEEARLLLERLKNMGAKHGLRTR